MVKRLCICLMMILIGCHVFAEKGISFKEPLSLKKDTSVNPTVLAQYPKVQQGEAFRGKLVKEILPAYKGTDVYHMLYLPTDYDRSAKKVYPIMVELTGNKWHEYSSGKVEDAHLSFSITLGKKFISIVAPYIAKNHQQNQLNWWGDVDATVDYLKKLVPYIVKKYHGDPNNVFLCGFSRGAIGVSFIGLHDDEVASLWKGFISHDHFDGKKAWKGNSWGYPLSTYRKEATERLMRAKGKPWYLSFNMQEKNTKQEYIQALQDMKVLNLIDFTIAPIVISDCFPIIPNSIFPHFHNDCWPIFDIQEGTRVRQWLRKELQP